MVQHENHFQKCWLEGGGMLLVPKFYSPICQTQISVLHNVTQYVDATTLQDKIIFCRSFPAKHACSISPRFQTGNLQNTTRILLYPGLTGSSLVATDLLIAAKSQPQPHDNLNPKLQKNRLNQLVRVVFYPSILSMPNVAYARLQDFGHRQYQNQKETQNWTRFRCHLAKTKNRQFMSNALITAHSSLPGDLPTHLLGQQEIHL